MRAYIAYAGDPHDGACLVFAHTVREAKRLAFPVVQGWTDCWWTDLRVRWLRDPGHDLHRVHCGPHVVEAPASCWACGQWGPYLPDDDGLCPGCAAWRREHLALAGVTDPQPTPDST